MVPISLSMHLLKNSACFVVTLKAGALPLGAGRLLRHMAMRLFLLYDLPAMVTAFGFFCTLLLLRRINK